MTRIEVPIFLCDAVFAGGLVKLIEIQRAIVLHLPDGASIRLKGNAAVRQIALRFSPATLWRSGHVHLFSPLVAVYSGGEKQGKRRLSYRSSVVEHSLGKYLLYPRKPK